MSRYSNSDAKKPKGFTIPPTILRLKMMKEMDFMKTQFYHPTHLAGNRKQIAILLMI